ncbi:MAG: hypothetical protein K0Q57_1114 [Gammaproteobacteria bacterium]|nr:hypothetical protein [Gammaproteobacteria bacterium]
MPTINETSNKPHPFGGKTTSLSESTDIIAAALEKGRLQKKLDDELLKAVANNDIAKATLLLSTGANPNALYPFYRSQLSMAIANRNPKMLELLLSYNANPYVPHDPHHPGRLLDPLLTAVASGDDAMVKIMLAYSDPRHSPLTAKYKGHHGVNSLHIAIIEGHYHLIEMIISAMAEHTLKDLADTAKQLEISVRKAIEEVKSDRSQEELNTLISKVEAVYDMLLEAFDDIEASESLEIPEHLLTAIKAITAASKSEHYASAEQCITSTMKIVEDAKELRLRPQTPKEAEQPFMGWNCHKQVLEAIESHILAKLAAARLIHTPEISLQEFLNAKTLLDHTPITLAELRGCPRTIAAISPKPAAQAAATAPANGGAGLARGISVNSGHHPSLQGVF